MHRFSIYSYRNTDDGIHRRGLIINVFGWCVALYVPMCNSIDVHHFGVGVRMRRWP